jgi:hypothetical protein
MRVGFGRPLFVDNPRVGNKENTSEQQKVSNSDPGSSAPYPSVKLPPFEAPLYEKDYRITTGFGNSFFREYCETTVKNAIN